MLFWFSLFWFLRCGFYFTPIHPLSSSPNFFLPCSFPFFRSLKLPFVYTNINTYTRYLSIVCRTLAHFWQIVVCLFTSFLYFSFADVIHCNMDGFFFSYYPHGERSTLVNLTLFVRSFVRSFTSWLAHYLSIAALFYLFISYLSVLLLSLRVQLDSYRYIVFRLHTFYQPYRQTIYSYMRVYFIISYEWNGKIVPS